MKKAANYTKIYWKELLVLATPVIVFASICIYNAITIGIEAQGLMTY